MAIDDIDLFRARLPEAFEDAPLPPGFADDWLVIPIDEPEAADAFDGELGAASPSPAPQTDGRPNAPTKGRSPVQLPTISTGSAGSPVHQWSSPYPPPDALAFYLPFHYYHPDWWGIYLTLEGTLELSDVLVKLSGGNVPPAVALHASRVFLHGHEAYHHAVEAFATRLEVTHRRPLYRLGFEALYRRGLGTDKAVEEALANAYALRRVATAFRGRKQAKLRRMLVRALVTYIKGCPPGYRLGWKFESTQKFMPQQREFAEDNHHAALNVPRDAGDLWTVFPQAFTGISRVTSRVNYIVHRSSSLARRLQLNLRYIQRRRVEQLLARQGCVLASTRGIHDKWKTPGGLSIPVPKHRDIANGTAKSILESAGLGGRLEDMLRG